MIERALVGAGHLAPVGERKADVSKILAADGNGAGLKIQVEYIFNLVRYHAVSLEHKSKRAVLISGELFAAVDRLVELNVGVACKLACQRQEPVKLIVVVSALDQIAHGDSTHVYHGIDVFAQERLIGNVYGVKRLARCLNADFAADELLAVIDERKQQQNGLHDTLNGKAFVIIACAGGASVAVENISAEIIHICIGKLGNVGGKPSAVGVCPAFFKEPFKQFFHKL